MEMSFRDAGNCLGHMYSKAMQHVAVCTLVLLSLYLISWILDAEPIEGHSGQASLAALGMALCSTLPLGGVA